jgi:phosphohistidine phosphatase
MKRLLLMRHAKAVQAADPLTDIARPLTERGERDARRIGERLRPHYGTPEKIVASPAARALKTAQLVATALGYPPAGITLERQLYLAEPSTLLEVIAGQSAGFETLLVVGHNPGLTELVHALLPSFSVDDLPTAALVAIHYRDLTTWAGLGKAAGQLAYYDFPKNPREPATAR